MKDFYPTSSMTCLKSSSLLSIILIMPILIYLVVKVELIAMVSILPTLAFIYKSSLCSAGINVLAIKLSQYGAFSRFIFVTIAVIINFILYLFIILYLVTNDLVFDYMRLAFILAAFGFLPFTTYSIASVFRPQRT